MSILIPFLLASVVAPSADDTLWTIYTGSNSGLPNNNVSDVAFDKSGNAWIATWGGVARFDGNTWQVFNQANSGLPMDLTNHISFDARGTVWIGTNGEGVVSYDGTKWIRYNLPSPNIALTVEVDSRGRKWIGTFTDGLYLLDGDNLTKVWGETGALEYNVNDILFDGDGNTWFATPQGAFVIPAGKTIPEKQPDFSGHVFDLDVDDQGSIWLATLPLGQLAWREKSKWRDLSYTTTAETDPLSSYHLQSVNVFPSGAILTGTPTRGELGRYLDGNWSRIITPFSDEMNEGISSVEIDNENNIWVGTWGQGLMISSHFAVDEETVAFDEIVKDGELEDRKIEEQSTVVCTNRNVTVRIWDRNKEDGDTVSVSLNGKWLVRNLGLTTKGNEYPVTLANGSDSYLILHAENLGKIPPNTAAMEVIDGGKLHRVTLSSDMTTSGTIRLVYRADP